jgi:hypothetical protein
MRLKLLVLVVLLGAFLFISFGLKNDDSNSNSETKSATETEKQIIGGDKDEGEKSDKELIKEVLVNKHDWNAEEIMITVSQNDGQYAKGGVGADGPGGGFWFAAKVDGNWEIVWDGNGLIMCEDLIDYPNFPTNLISSCYDSLANETVER